MGKNQISSFACNTIKSFSNNDKWREQRDVSQLRRRSLAATAEAPLQFFFFFLTQKLIKPSNGIFSPPSGRTITSTLLDRACQGKLNF